MKALVALAIAGSAVAVTTLQRPPFRGPVTSAPAATHLHVVSSHPIAPGLGGPERRCHEFGYPDSVRGLPQQRAICPGGPSFVLYGRDGASSRVLAGRDYAFDFENYVWPPHIRPGERELVYEELVWAREAGGVLYVENAHSTYARSSYGQNAYITALDPKTGKRLWRSKALVANAQTFLVTPRYLVTGYGFTAEPDWLYLLDRKSGRVVERLALPSGPERLTKSGGHIIVRTYDHVLTVDLRNP